MFILDSTAGSDRTTKAIERQIPSPSLSVEYATQRFRVELQGHCILANSTHRFQVESRPKFLGHTLNPLFPGQTLNPLFPVINSQHNFQPIIPWLNSQLIISCH